MEIYASGQDNIHGGFIIKLAINFLLCYAPYSAVFHRDFALLINITGPQKTAPGTALLSDDLIQKRRVHYEL